MKTNTILLGLLMIALFTSGFLVGRFSTIGTMGVGSFGMTATVDKNSETGAEAQNTDTPVVSGESKTDTTISANNLTDGQRKMLTAMGIDADKITITAEMIACAEAKVGATRVEEIKNGATPSFSEGVSLMACYSK